MQPFNLMALFCEDIREEKGGSLMLIGLLPDTVNLKAPDATGTITQIEEDQEPDKLLAKLCVYLRINFDPAFDLGEPTMRLVLPNDEAIPIGTISAAVAKKAASEAKEKGNLFAGLISRAVLVGFRPPKMGTVKVEITISGKAYVAGALNFQMDGKKPTSPTEH